MFAKAPGDCGTSDVFRSYFSVPAPLPTVTGFPAYEITVVTSAAFGVGAGGGTQTVYLSGIMLNGGSPYDADSNDLVTLEFFPNQQ